MASLNVEYLKRNVGEALSRGISATVIEQPEDPIDFLGMWLMQYRKNEQHQQTLESTYQNLERERLAHEQQLQFEAQQKLASEAEVASKKSEEERLMYDLDHAEEGDLLEIEDLETYEKSKPPLWDRTLELLQRRLGLSDAYIALVELDQAAMDAQLPKDPAADDDDADPADPPPDEAAKPEVTEIKHLRYCAATPSNKFMLGKTLSQVPEDASAKAAGITYDALAFKEKEPGQTTAPDGDTEATPADPADEDEDAEEKGRELEYSGRTVYVKNVIEEPRVKFFAQPQLGSLLIVPIKDGRQDLKGIISMDTLGKGFHDDFTSEQIALAEQLGQFLGKNIDRLTREREAKAAEDRAKAEEDNESLAAAYATKQEAEAKELEALPADEPEEIMKQTRAETKMASLKTYLKQEVEDKKFMELKTSAGDNAKVVRVCQAVFYMLGKTKKEVAKWDQVRKIVTVGLADTLDQFECSSDKESNLFNRAERAIRGIEMEDVQVTSFAAAMLLQYVKVAVELYQANVGRDAWDKKEAERLEAEAKAAEEAAAAAEENEGDEDA